MLTLQLEQIVKLKTISFYDEVYKQNILFCIGDSEKTKKYVYKNAKIKIEFDGKDGGLTFDCTESRKGIIIWLISFNRKPEDFGYLIHEILHCTFFTMANKGIKLKDDDFNESFTYYSEFLMRKFLELYSRIENRKTKRKGE